MDGHVNEHTKNYFDNANMKGLIKTDEEIGEYFGNIHVANDLVSTLISEVYETNLTAFKIYEVLRTAVA